MPERITLYFAAPKRKGLVGVTTYKGLPVFLCGQRNCQLCNLSAREQLGSWPGGKLEVELGLYRRPSFFRPQPFYSGHLFSIIEREQIDTGGEVDISGLNTICLRISSGLIVIDPGGMGFNGGLSLASLIDGQRIIGTVVSHGHQDHWNLADQVRGPIYVSGLTSRLIDRHLAFEWNPQLARARHWMKEIKPGQRLFLDSVQIETFSLPHTIPETMGLDIRGSSKRMVYLGDLRLSGWEGKTRAETIATLQKIARERVDLLAMTIFNAHFEGFTPIEALMIDTLTNILVSTSKRVLVTCFSSNLERVWRIAQVAQILQRPVAFCGAGMRNAQELLGIRAEEDARDAESAVVFVTGSQAEEFSVLWRISQHHNPPFELRPDDTIAFSSRCIPGNEEAGLGELISGLRPQVKKIVVHQGEVERLGLGRLGVEEALTHVVGHANKADLRLVLEILRPAQVLAWPQVSPQIEAFRGLAEPFGIEILPETERVIEI